MRIFWRKIILLFVVSLFLSCLAVAKSLPASHPRPVHFSKISHKNLLKIYREAERSVVEIDTDAAQGSGVVVGKEGVIVTNYHAEEASFSRQKLDPKFYEVKAELNELAALSNSGFSSARSPFEQHLQFTSVFIDY